MKTNMGKVFVAFLCMMMCLSLNAQDLTPGMVVGMWNFSAPDAPYGYQEGTARSRKPVRTCPPFSRSAALK